VSYTVAAVALIGVIAGLPPALMNNPDMSVPVDIDRHGAVFVDVHVNDSGPYRFIVDTGSSRSIISETLARELGAPVVARSEIVTVAGSEWRSVVRLDSISLAAARRVDILAPVLPAARLSELGPSVRGLLAQDFLSLFAFTLDYRHARIRWASAPSCSAAEAAPLVEAEGRFVLTLVDDSGMPLRLVPDSGAEVPVLFRRRHARETTTGIISVKVGTVKIQGLVAYIVERGDANADGLLPLHHFNEVTFAGGACLVVR
jgi:predicted aspartyl protease